VIKIIQPITDPSHFYLLFQKFLKRFYVGIRLLEHIKNNNILVKEEFGFISKLSKEVTSYGLISDILNALNNKNIIGGIICVLTKAY